MDIHNYGFSPILHSTDLKLSASMKHQFDLSPMPSPAATDLYKDQV